MKYSGIGFNDAFIAAFETQTAWLKYASQNKHWGLTKEQLKELYHLCSLKHGKVVPLAGDESEDANEDN